MTEKVIETMWKHWQEHGGIEINRLVSVFLICSVGCAAPAPAPEERSDALLRALAVELPSLAQEPASELVGELAEGGQRTVVLFDLSQSMLQNDPDRIAFRGIGLLAALSRPEDALGVVGYHNWAIVLQKLASVGHEVERARYSEIRQKFAGQTNYVAALGLGYDMLDEAKAPAGSLTVFLSDGFPSVGGKAESILAQAGRFKERGWRIVTVALGRVVDRRLLTEISVLTGGSHHRAATAKELLVAFAEIAAENMGYLVVPGFAPLPVPPSTSRLAYVAGGGKIEAVRLDGLLVGGLRYRSSMFDASLTVDPLQGIYTVDVSGEPEISLTLVNAGFRVEFVEDMPASTDGAKIPVAIRVIPSAGATLPPMDQLVVRVRFEEATGGELRAAVDLEPSVLKQFVLDKSRGLVFEGEVANWNPDKPEQVNVIGEVQYRVGGAVLQLSRRVSISVQADAGAIEREKTERETKMTRALFDLVQVGPVKLSGRFGWAEAKVVFTHKGEFPVQVKWTAFALEGQGAVLKPTVDIEIEDGGWDGAFAGPGRRGVTYRVFLSSDMARGRYTGRLLVTGSSAALGAVAASLEVELEVQ